MSKLKAQGNASGTGVFTLQTPATNTDRTITLPDSTGTLLNNGDAISLADSVKATFGTSNDLEIYHNGTHSFIDNVGTGNLYIRDTNGTGDVYIRPETSQEGIIIYNDGAVVLHNNGANKLATTSTGVDVTGDVNTSGNIFISNPSPDLYFETGSSHTNWRVAAQEAVNNGLEFSSGAVDGDASNDTYTPRMVIDAVGRVFIGKTAFSNAGTGFIFQLDSTHGAVVRNTRENNTSAQSHYRFYTNGGSQIGQISTTTSSTSYVTSSDYRLKENVVPMSASIDRLKQLNPVNFNFIVDADTTVDGFLAHEAQAVVPEAVTGDKDAMTTEEYEVTPAVEATYDEDGNELTPAIEAVMGTREVEDYQGIDQSKLVPLLTSALQEAVAKIEALEQRVTTLEGGTV